MLWMHQSTWKNKIRALSGAQSRKLEVPCTPISEADINPEVNPKENPKINGRIKGIVPLINVMQIIRRTKQPRQVIKRI